MTAPPNPYQLANACPICGATVHAQAASKHATWHEEEAERVERALLQRARTRENRHAH